MSKKKNYDSQVDPINAYQEFQDKYIKGVLKIQTEESKDFERELEELIVGSEASPSDNKREEKAKVHKPVTPPPAPIVIDENRPVTTVEPEPVEEEPEPTHIFFNDDEEDEDIIILPIVILKDKVDTFGIIEYIDGRFSTYVNVDQDIDVPEFTQGEFIDTMDDDDLGHFINIAYKCLINLSYPAAVFTKEEFEKTFVISGDLEEEDNEFFFIESSEKKYVSAYQINPSFVHDLIDDVCDGDVNLAAKILLTLCIKKAMCVTCFKQADEDAIRDVYKLEENSKWKEKFIEEFNKVYCEKEKTRIYRVERIIDDIHAPWKEIINRIDDFFDDASEEAEAIECYDETDENVDVIDPEPVEEEPDEEPLIADAEDVNTDDIEVPVMYKGHKV